LKRNDLHPNIRSEYNEEKSCGVEKVDAQGYENIFFVIPPPLPKDRLVLTKI
jgi:hypothetical protein